MDRLGLLILVLAGCASATLYNCENTLQNFPQEVCRMTACTDAIKTQIQHELDAAFTYMYLGSHFGQATIDRPGMAKFLFEAASEERGHAILMLDYLNLRGIKMSPLEYKFTRPGAVDLPDLPTYEQALILAIQMEIKVTDLIYKIVDDCKADFHGADVFTDPILSEQHDGLRKLQGALKSLRELKKGHSREGLDLAEYLFDRKMLSGAF